MGDATISQWTDFIKYSPIWKDMKNELESWLSDIRDQLENTTHEYSPRILDRLGGNAESIRNVLSMPVILLEEKTMEQDKK